MEISLWRHSCRCCLPCEVYTDSKSRVGHRKLLYWLQSSLLFAWHTNNCHGYFAKGQILWFNLCQLSGHASMNFFHDWIIQQPVISVLCEVNEVCDHILILKAVGFALEVVKKESSAKHMTFFNAIEAFLKWAITKIKGPNHSIFARLKKNLTAI